MVNDFDHFIQSAPKYLTSKDEPTAQDLREFHDWFLSLPEHQVGWLDLLGRE